MAQRVFVDSSTEYQKREGYRVIGWVVIGILIFMGAASLLKGSFGLGLVLILIGVFLGWLSRMGDKRNRKIYGRE